MRVSEGDNDTRQLLEDMNLHNVELVGWMPQSDMLGVFFTIVQPFDSLIGLSLSVRAGWQELPLK